MNTLIGIIIGIIITVNIYWTIRWKAETTHLDYYRDPIFMDFSDKKEDSKSE